MKFYYEIRYILNQNHLNNIIFLIKIVLEVRYIFKKFLEPKIYLFSLKFAQ